MGDVKDQQIVLTAQANVKKTWQKMLDLAKVDDRDQPLKSGEKIFNGEWIPTKGGLSDPTSQVVALILYVYQMENYCYSELNRAARFKDSSKLQTLGPYAYALGWIINVT